MIGEPRRSHHERSHRRHAGRRRDVNMRSAFIPVAGDTFSRTHAVIAAAAQASSGQARTGSSRPLSILIAAMILWSSPDIVRETLNILLEARRAAYPSTKSAQAWNPSKASSTSTTSTSSLGSQPRPRRHVQIKDIPPRRSNRALLLDINSLAKDSFHIHHTTIQFEFEGCEVTHGCVVPNKCKCRRLQPRPPPRATPTRIRSTQESVRLASPGADIRV